MTLCHCGYEHMAHGCCEIVERLKKRIEEFDEYCKSSFNEGHYDSTLEARLDELQKILEGDLAAPKTTGTILPLSNKEKIEWREKK